MNNIFLGNPNILENFNFSKTCQPPMKKFLQLMEVYLTQTSNAKPTDNHLRYAVKTGYKLLEMYYLFLYFFFFKFKHVVGKRSQVNIFLMAVYFDSSEKEQYL